MVAHHRDCFFIRNMLDFYIRRDSTLNAANSRRIPKRRIVSTQLNRRKRTANWKPMKWVGSPMNSKRDRSEEAKKALSAATLRGSGLRQKDGGCPPSILECAKLNELLERYASGELDLPASDRGAGDDGSLARSDSIVSRLAKAGVVQHVPGICPDLQLHTTIRPHIERLAE
jgi:hypothetical protein